MSEIWFDERDDAAELIKALEAEGYDVALRSEGFAGEEDSEDHAWLLTVEPYDDRVTEMVDVYGGWLPDDHRLPRDEPHPASPPPELPDAPKRLKRPRD